MGDAGGGRPVGVPVLLEELDEGLSHPVHGPFQFGGVKGHVCHPGGCFFAHFDFWFWWS